MEKSNSMGVIGDAGARRSFRGGCDARRARIIRAAGPRRRARRGLRYRTT